MTASNAVFEHRSRNDPFDSINNCIKHCFVDIVATDNQGNGPAWNRVHNRSKTLLMTVHDQIRMRFRNDGYAADIVYHLNQSADATSFIEPLICKALPVQFCEVFPVNRQDYPPRHTRESVRGKVGFPKGRYPVRGQSRSPCRPLFSAVYP